jgi:hypothetical protein
LFCQKEEEKISKLFCGFAGGDGVICPADYERMIFLPGIQKQVVQTASVFLAIG